MLLPPDTGLLKSFPLWFETPNQVLERIPNETVLRNGAFKWWLG